MQLPLRRLLLALLLIFGVFIFAFAVGRGWEDALSAAGAFASIVTAALAGNSALAHSRRSVPRRGQARGSVLLRAAAGLLPGAAAARYREEWAGELYDQSAEGVPWWRRAVYVAGVLLCAVPVLAITLRLALRQAVD